MFLTKKIDGQGRRGSAYVEYFVAAAAFAAAAMWLFDSGEFHGLRSQMQGRFNSQMNDLAGPVR